MLHSLEVRVYQTPDGRRPYEEWIQDLKDRRGAAIIRNRLKRIRLGQLGDYKRVGKGVWEFRIFYGPGYRVYFLMDQGHLIILLCGGDKDTQSRTIAQAHIYAEDYWRQK